MTYAVSGAKVNVVGLGATGLSLVRFLSANGAQVSVFDGNANAAGLDVLRRDFPRVKFAQHDVARDPLPSCDWIALSPGVPRSSGGLKAAERSGRRIVGDIELFAQFNKGEKPVIGITGSNGKTTTSQLTGALLEKSGVRTSVAGNVGLPALDALADSGADVFVLELSSFQLESTDSLVCASATVLNVTENHLDRYSSFFDYAASKAKIFRHCERQVINRDDVWSSSMRRLHAESVSFGLSAPKDESEFGLVQQGDAQFVAQGARSIASCQDMHLRGTHNIANALAAISLASPHLRDATTVQQTLSAFEGIAHRYQWLGRVGGVDVINDSKATTVVATEAALRGSNSPLWLIAGGDGKGQQFSALAAGAAKRCKAVHLIGRDARQIGAELASHGVEHRYFATLEDAVHAALERAQSGDTLLLSPACASWDMFKNYEARALAFAQAVNAWASAHGRTLVREPGHA